jgi:hypothetical protein
MRSCCPRKCLMIIPADCTLTGGRVSLLGGKDNNLATASGHFENCHMSGSFLGQPCVLMVARTSLVLRRCTVQASQRSNDQKVTVT